MLRNQREPRLVLGGGCLFYPDCKLSKLLKVRFPSNKTAFFIWTLRLKVHKSPAVQDSHKRVSFHQKQSESGILYMAPG